jgi:3',5'-cyclic AMP phosphodiesterase CpdA
LRRLVDAADLRDVLADKGAELLLHGHDHRRALIWLDGPKTKIPAVGVPSASARAPHDDENSAGYNLFHIDGEAGNWRCEMIGRERDAEGVFRDAERSALY